MRSKSLLAFVGVMAMLCLPAFAQSTGTKYTFAAIQLSGTKVDGGGTVMLDGSGKAQVDVSTSFFSYKGEATVVKVEKLPDPFQQNIKTTDVYFIESPKFWMVLATNPFTEGSSNTPSGSFEGKSGGIWSIAAK